MLGSQTSLLDAFKEANDVLLGAVQGIADLIIRPGLVNVDFADVRTVMSEMGAAMMGTGTASGEHRAREAAERAINSPLLDDIDLSGARGILVNITAGLDLSLGEFSEVGSTIEDIASEDATVVVGTVIDPELTDTLKVTVVATGLRNMEFKPTLATVEPTVAKRPVATASDYKDYDLPPGRRPAAAPLDGQAAVKLDDSLDEQLFDVPAFLRRQAD